MIVEPLFTIGEVVRDVDAPSKVFEIVGIVTSIRYTELLDALEERVSYAIVDIKEDTHIALPVIEDRLLLTDVDDIESYMSDEELKSLAELDDLFLYSTDMILQGEAITDGFIEGVTKATVELTKSIDDLLDEYNDHKVLIDMFGDEDGYYERRLKEIEDEIKDKQ